jgi:hypothetical protein
LTDFESAARAVTGRLELLGLAYALVGGFAVSIRAEPRFTRDIDLVVAVTDDVDLELARHSVGLIEARGYQRGKDLAADLENLVGPS